MRSSAARRGRPPKADAIARQDAFLDHSLQEFMSSGYRATTMEGLALTFGMSKSTIYRRYDSKAGLLRAAMERGVPLLAEALAAVPTGPARDPRDVLRDHATVLQDHHDDPRMRMLWQAVSEARNEPGVDLNIVATMQREALAPITAYLSALEQRGVTKLGDVVQATICFSDMCTGGVSNFLSDPRPTPDRRRAMRFAVDLFLHGALRGGEAG